MKSFSKKSVSLVLIFTMLMAIFMPSMVNATDVNRIGTSKVGRIYISYTAGNSQVYVNKITKTDGTVVRYVYSSNFLVNPATIAKLKSVLASEYSALIPDNYKGEDNVGIKVCSDSSLVDSMNENWKSSEWVGKNVVAVRSIKNITNETGDGINQTAISNAQSHNVLFNEITNNVENMNKEIWEQSELEKKAAWDEAEAAKHEADSTYIPQEYVSSEYVPVDFGELTASDIENIKTLEENQIELSAGINLTKHYEFLNQKLEEVTNIESVNHVASIYSSHTLIDDTESITQNSSLNTSTDNTKIEEELTYEYIDNTANQTYTISKDDALMFRINADYSLFENGGKVYVDGTETKEFTASSGSTIITFAKNYASSLSEGEHTLKVAFNNGGEALTKFTIAKAEETSQAEIVKIDETKTEEVTSNNPKTGDNIVIWISLMVVSMLVVVGIIIYIKKRK